MPHTMRRGWLTVVCLTCLSFAPWPSEPARADDAQRQPAEEAAGRRGAYELRMIRVGDTYQGIRFRQGTGETWLIVADKWERLAESGPVPAGDYDVVLVGSEANFTAFRFNRRTGRTWQLKERKWAMVQEVE